jgi:hypothetical protein
MMKRGFVLIATGMILMTGCQDEKASTSPGESNKQEVTTISSEPKVVQSQEIVDIIEKEQEKQQQPSTYIEKRETQVNQKVEQKKESVQQVKKEQPPVSFREPVEMKKEEQPKKKTGVVEKETKQPTVTKQNETKQEGITYKDEKYPFTLQLPSTWQHVQTKRDIFDPHAKDVVSFTVNMAGEDCSLVSIFVFDSQAEAMSHIEFGPLSKLGEKDGLIYAYVRASEAPGKLYGQQYEKELKMVQKMIVEEVPAVMSSFTLFPSK